MKIKKFSIPEGANLSDIIKALEEMSEGKQKKSDKDDERYDKIIEKCKKMAIFIHEKFKELEKEVDFEGHETTKVLAAVVSNLLRSIIDEEACDLFQAYSYSINDFVFELSKHAMKSQIMIRAEMEKDNDDE